MKRHVFNRGCHPDRRTRVGGECGVEGPAVRRQRHQVPRRRSPAPSEAVGRDDNLREKKPCYYLPSAWGASGPRKGQSPPGMYNSLYELTFRPSICGPGAHERKFVMPVRVLPPNPNLDQLKHQAKDLIKAHAAAAWAQRNCSASSIPASAPVRTRPYSPLPSSSATRNWPSPAKAAFPVGRV